jgi:hypothetical protein
MKRIHVFAALLAAAPAFANDIDPLGLEKAAGASATSRAQVVAELRAAQAAGQLPRGEVGVAFAAEPSTKTRAQVVAETLEAARLGVLAWRGDIAPVIATPAQERQIQLAGLRAREHTAEK